jgi:hypothetical protein
MRKLMIATAAATALLAGASVASAQTFQNDGPDYRYRSPGVGVQIGPFGAGVYAQPEYGYVRPYGYQSPDGTTENSRAFQSQEVWPQSPPGGS